MSSPEEVLRRSKALVRARVEAKESQELLEKLPQGHGSGLDADMVDGLHAFEIIAKVPRGGGGGGGGGDMKKDVYDPDVDGVVVDSDKVDDKHAAEVSEGAFLQGIFKKIEATTYNGDGTLAEGKICNSVGDLLYILSFTWASNALSTIVQKNAEGGTIRTYTFTWNLDGSFQKVEVN
jgi:hypothetical protein